MAREPYKKGTTVYASSCRVYKVNAKFNMYISRCVFIYIYIYIYNSHVTSAFGVFVDTILMPDDIPWVNISRCK